MDKYTLACTGFEILSTLTSGLEAARLQVKAGDMTNAEFFELFDTLQDVLGSVLNDLLEETRGAGL